MTDLALSPSAARPRKAARALDAPQNIDNVDYFSAPSSPRLDDP
jgi:hypothetical protein